MKTLKNSDSINKAGFDDRKIYETSTLSRIK